MYAEVVDSQYQFSTDWLGMSKSYLSTIKALNEQDISRNAAETLEVSLSDWLGQQNNGKAKSPRLDHAISEGSTALTALRERLN